MNINSSAASTIKNATKNSVLEQAYSMIDESLKRTNFYIVNAITKIHDHVYVTVAGNINEELPTLVNNNQIVKVVTKKNKVFYTIEFLKKDLAKNNDKVNKKQEEQPKQEEPKKDIKSLFEGISVFKNKYDDGHSHEYNKDGYCYYCGVNKAQLELAQRINQQIDDIISNRFGKDILKYLGKEERFIYSTLLRVGIKDDYLIGQLTGMIKEIAKGSSDGFNWYPDETYLNEKVRKVLSRIEENKQEAQKQRERKKEIDQ